jgi:hypothetical protein
MSVYLIVYLPNVAPRVALIASSRERALASMKFGRPHAEDTLRQVPLIRRADRKTTRRLDL